MPAGAGGALKPPTLEWEKPSAGGGRSPSRLGSACGLGPFPGCDARLDEREVELVVRRSPLEIAITAAIPTAAFARGYCLAQSAVFQVNSSQGFGSSPVTAVVYASTVARLNKGIYTSASRMRCTATR